jgi:hypothetical protein
MDLKFKAKETNGTVGPVLNHPIAFFKFDEIMKHIVRGRRVNLRDTMVDISQKII